MRYTRVKNIRLPIVYKIQLYSYIRAPTTLALYSEIYMDSRSRQEATLERGLRLRNALRNRARAWRSRTDEEDIAMCARVDSALPEQAPPPLRAYACALHTRFHTTYIRLKIKWRRSKRKSPRWTWILLSEGQTLPYYTKGT